MMLCTPKAIGGETGKLQVDLMFFKSRDIDISRHLNCSLNRTTSHDKGCTVKTGQYLRFSHVRGRCTVPLTSLLRLGAKLVPIRARLGYPTF